MDRLDVFFLWIGLPLWIGGMATLIVLLYQISQLLRKILTHLDHAQRPDDAVIIQDQGTARRHGTKRTRRRLVANWLIRPPRFR
jgi:hypothetical protein